MKRLPALCIAVLVLMGCKSNPLSVVVSPRVMGRVVAADTGQPLAEVKIRSGARAEDFGATEPPKGGERLIAKAAVRTDPDGRFVLETERVLTPFRASGWFAVQLYFEHPGYERFLTNYSYLNLRTNTWRGEPVLDAGIIRLRPTAK